MEKDLSTSYVLAIVGLFTPVAGLHYFYLNQPVIGVAYLLTWGFCGIGSIIDLFRLPALVENENLRGYRLRSNNPLHMLPEPPMAPPVPPPPTPEQRILQAANAKGGALTIALASLETGMSLDECRRLLTKMADAKYCQRDVSEHGEDLYVFAGLLSNKPFEL